MAQYKSAQAQLSESQVGETSSETEETEFDYGLQAGELTF